ncbi:hypothetical protein HOY80DRAFT_1081879 [Tuber brumale]|nr:hypothetical protein HOY80DRAFT_1081879 [Tuber brumale]
MGDARKREKHKSLEEASFEINIFPAPMILLNGVQCTVLLTPEHMEKQSHAQVLKERFRVHSRKREDRWSVKVRKGRKSAIILEKKLKYLRFPPPSLLPNFASFTLAFALLADYITCHHTKKMYCPATSISRCNALPRQEAADVTYLLVDFDELGNPLGLPPRLGDLPLYPEEDDWYSVLGSWNGAAGGIGAAGGVGEINPENNIVIPVSALNPPRNARAGLRLIFCQYHKCSGNSGPHTCAPGRFTCDAPGCSWPGTFSTKQAFNRHYLAKHHDDRVNCPVEGCVHVGDRGIKRADNLPAHLLNKHGISRARPPYGN